MLLFFFEIILLFREKETKILLVLGKQALYSMYNSFTIGHTSETTIDRVVALTFELFFQDFARSCIFVKGIFSHILRPISSVKFCRLYILVKRPID